MYSLFYTNQFRRSVKRCQRRGYNLALLEEVASILELHGELPPHYKPHKLSGQYHDCWECHILRDWLLIWKQDDSLLTLLFLDTGTHSDLF